MEDATNKKNQTLIYGKLLIAVLIDLIGMSSYLIPGLGEFADVVWAPFAAAANFFLFRGAVGAAGSLFTLAEELLPGSDWIPSLTLTWFVKYGLKKDKQKKKRVRLRFPKAQTQENIATRRS